MKKHDGEILRILLVKEITRKNEIVWVAQGLDYDMATQGPSIPVALQALKRMLYKQVALDKSEGKTPLDGIPMAPKEYWDCFENAISIDPKNAEGGFEKSAIVNLPSKIKHTLLKVC